MDSKSKLLINGVFDIIHPGHLKLFNYGLKITKNLFVAIDSDARVKNFKGSDRPINSQLDREAFLRELGYFKDVFIFHDKSSYEELVTINHLDYLLIGEEWRSQSEMILGKELFKEILFYPRDSNWSTTKIIEAIRESD